MLRIMAIALSLGCAGLGLSAAPIRAQQAAQLALGTSSQPFVLDPSAAADAGKARYFIAPDLPPSPNCVAMLDCRLKVIGAVQHNGAVEVNGALFKW
jgi:hypothetical protein